VTDRALQYYRAQSGSLWRHLCEELLMLAAGWIPGGVGIAVRGPAWRALIGGKGLFAADTGVVIKHSGTITIDSGVFLDRRVYLHGGEKFLIIGSGTRIMHGAQVMVYNYRDLECSFIRIGSNCVIGPGCVITGQGGVTIGNDVIIGPKALILPVDHNYSRADVSIREQGIRPLPINISDNVWIGGGAEILGGSEIGSGSVVGAGSVVKGPVPARSVVAGNPAKVIKYLDENQD